MKVRNYRKILMILMLGAILCLAFSCNRNHTTYTVSFQTDGGTIIAPITVDEKHNSFTLPSDPTRLGYVFEGWFLDPQRTDPVSAENNTLTTDHNITLYAKWSPNVNSFSSFEVTLIFDSMGGQEIASYNINTSESFKNPPTPVSAHYKFGGWYLDKDSWQIPYSANYLASITSKTTLYLYARWTAATCEHSFEQNTFPCRDRKCTICGEIVAATESHQFQTEVINGTCMKVGFIRHTCTVCSLVVENETTTEYAHTPGDAATCTTGQYCTVCNAELVKALGHKAAAAADCTHASLCSVCGEEINPALGHLPGSAATCTVGQYCSRCLTVIAPPRGHDYSAEYTIDKEATCTVSGWRSRHCTRCTTAYTDRTEIPPRGHYTSATPTCSDPALCDVCGAVVLRALGHQFVTRVVEPTETEVGYTIYTCTRCGIAHTGNAVNALGYPLSYDAGTEYAVGNLPTSEYVVAGATIYLPVSGTIRRNGYIFAGWSDGNKVYPGGSTYTMPKHSLNFTAVWLSSDYEYWTLIYTEYDLLKVQRTLYNHYVLMNDLNLSGVEWEPFGGDTGTFNGLFDGNGKTISNFKMVEEGHTFYGFFGRITGQIKNLTLRNFTIKGNSDYPYCGAIAAYVDRGGIISNCHAYDGSVSGMCITGGLVGYAHDATIRACSAAVSVVGTYEGTLYNTYAGGIIAWCDGVTITDCYSTGSVSASGQNAVAGGLAAQLKQESVIKRCYVSAASILAYSLDRVAYGGGLVGYATDNSTISQCFSLASVDLNISGTYLTYYYSGQILAEGDISTTECYYSAAQTSTRLNKPSEFSNVIGTVVTDETFFNFTFLSKTLEFEEYTEPLSFFSASTAVWVYSQNALPVLYGNKDK